MGYFDHKEELSQKAKQRTEYMEYFFGPMIQKCAEEAIIYDDAYLKSSIRFDMVTEGIINRTPINTPIIELKDCSTVQCITNQDPSDNIVTLNFSSYKNPGGMFINGSSAQEESLCHSSFLYNVLRKRQDFYDWNCKHKNNNMYTNRALICPPIPFNYYGITVDSSVITCAAPNNRYNNPENATVIDDRIKFVLSCASDYAHNNSYMTPNKNKILILGAYGCGVFRQDPFNVANIFKKYIYGGYTDAYDKVIFAILPGQNFYTFKNVFG